jgi:hypothetical protein
MILASNLHEDIPYVGLQDSFPTVGPQGQISDVTSFLDDHLLAELGWTNNATIFYPPIATGPYGTDWYSPNDVNGFAL